MYDYSHMTTRVILAVCDIANVCVWNPFRLNEFLNVICNRVWKRAFNIARMSRINIIAAQRVTRVFTPDQAGERAHKKE